MVCLREMSRHDAVFLLSAFPKSKSSGRVKIQAEYERCKTRPLPPIPTK
jgi:hypothetical protein